MKALILAAGYATRLYPLTKKYPKSLLLVGGKPIINYIVEKLEDIKDIEEIIVVTNSKFFENFKLWKRSLKTKKPVVLVDDLTSTEKTKRGAIGDMDFVIENSRIKDDLLVIGGDNIFDAGLKSFLKFAKANNPRPIIGVFDIKNLKKANKYGVIKLDKNKRIVDFKEKPKKPHSTLVAMCLYYFPKEKISLIGEYLGSKMNKNDATGFYIDWLRKKETVCGFKFTGRWYDIGNMGFYNEAKKKFSK